jgi:hypothetical protein
MGVRSFRWAILLAAVAACGGPRVEREGDPAIEAHPRISPTPPMAGRAILAVEVTDGGVPAPEGTRVTGAATLPGHSLEAPRELAYRGPGRWEGEMAFPEPGEVRLEVTVTLSGGRSATFRYPVTVTRRPGG